MDKLLLLSHGTTAGWDLILPHWPDSILAWPNLLYILTMTYLSYTWLTSTFALCTLFTWPASFSCSSSSPHLHPCCHTCIKTPIVFQLYVHSQNVLFWLKLLHIRTLPAQLLCTYQWATNTVFAFSSLQGFWYWFILYAYDCISVLADSCRYMIALFLLDASLTSRL